MLDLVPLAGAGGKWETVIGSLSSSASARVAEIAEASAQGGVMTAQQVLEELSKFASANMLDWSKLGRDQTAALIEVTRWRTDGRGEYACEVRRAKFGLANKIDALHLLGQHYRLFVERHLHDFGPASASAWRQGRRAWTVVHGVPMAK